MLPIQLIRVLLVEDDEQDYFLFRQALRADQCEFAVDWVSSMADALLVLETHAYHVVITDLGLPDCRGQEAVHKLRPHCPNTPIMVFTMHDDEVLGSELLEAGAQDFLVKGEMSSRHLSRSIIHAVQRQLQLNESQDLLGELEHSRETLRMQAKLLKRKNRKLKRLCRTAQEFVDNVSHDLRTPLTVIKDYAAIVQEEMIGPLNERQRDMLGKLRVRADDLNNTVDDLLDGSKLQAGLLTVWRRQISVNDILQRTRSIVQQRADARAVHLSLDVPADLPDVYCDMEKAVRILTNLSVNAIKYVPNGGFVKLRCQLDQVNHSIWIHVEDNGPGIEPEALQRIFERFNRLSCQVRSTVKGFGLGLSIAQNLARLNLGTLKVDSTEGVGSTFSLELPLADPAVVVQRALQHRNLKSDTVAFYELQTLDQSGNFRDEFDCFLQGSLRKNDLLINLDSSRWLMMIVTHPLESKNCLERIQREFLRYNRNRPGGAIPDYQVRSLFVTRPGQSLESANLLFQDTLQELRNHVDSETKFNSQVQESQ